MRMLCVWWCDMKCKIWLVFDWYLIGILKLAISFIFFPNLEMITMNESKYQLESCDFDVYGGDLYDWYLTGIFLWAISYETLHRGSFARKSREILCLRSEMNPRTALDSDVRACGRKWRKAVGKRGNCWHPGGVPVFAQEYIAILWTSQKIYNTKWTLISFGIMHAKAMCIVCEKNV